MFWSNNVIKTGAIEIAITEPKETYLDKYVITPQIAAIIKPTGQQRAKIVPTPVATDFPPVNPKKIDLLCPRIAAIAAKTGDKPKQAIKLKYLTQN